MKLLFRIAILLGTVFQAVQACTQPLFELTGGSMPVNGNIGDTVVLRIPATSTSYDGSNGNGAVRIDATAPNPPFQVLSITWTLDFGDSEPGFIIVTVKITANSQTLTSPDITLTPYCGTFVGSPVLQQINLPGSGSPPHIPAKCLHRCRRRADLHGHRRALHPAPCR